MQASMSLAVIGTDTEVGKTIACAVLLRRYGPTAKLAYWKPIATGSSQDSDSLTIRQLCGSRVRILEECYLFEPPVSPHLAALRAGTEIEPSRVVAQLRHHLHSESGRALVVEGIGGVLVPLTNSGYLLADLLEEMGLACLVVASTRVGTINHTLLTLQALRCRNLKLAGVLLNGPPNPDNRRAIERFGRVEVVAELEPLEPLSAATIDRISPHFDRGGKLKSYLERT